MQESMYRRPSRGGTEVDAFSKASKRAIKWGHSQRAKIKRAARRRERRAYSPELAW